MKKKTHYFWEGKPSFQLYRATGYIFQSFFNKFCMNDCEMTLQSTDHFATNIMKQCTAGPMRLVVNGFSCENKGPFLLVPDLCAKASNSSIIFQTCGSDSQVGMLTHRFPDSYKNQPQGIIPCRIQLLETHINNEIH